MKKRTSTAGLALALSRHGVLIIGIICLIQAFLFWRQQQPFGEYFIGLEQVIEREGIAFWGKWGFFILMLGMTSCCSAPQTSMTLRRLRIREWEVTAIFALVFFGWFVIYWAVQLLLLVAMFFACAETAGWGMFDLFLSSYISPYFHLVLPLSEPWGVARNIVLCLIFATTASVCGLHARHGSKPYMQVVIAILTAMFLPHDMASANADIAAIAVLTAVLAAYIWTVKGALDNEN